MRNDFYNYLIKDKVMYLVDTNYKLSDKSLETLITIKEDVLEKKDFNIDFINTTTRKMGLGSPIENLGENKKMTTIIQKRNKDLKLEKNIMKYTIVKHLATNGISDFKDLDFMNKTEVIKKIYQLGSDPLIELIKNTDSNEWGDNFDLLYGI